MPKSLSGLFFFFILVLLFSTSVSQPSFASPAAQDGTSLPPSRENNSATDPWRNLQYANTSAELLAKAQTQGRVRVIVGLNLNTRFQPEGELSTTQALVQRNALTQARNSLIRSLTPYGAIVLAQSNQWTIPYLALRINAAGLQALQSSQQVSSIQEDHLNFLSNNTASLTNMGVPPAWTNGYDGSGYTVAVIDIGVQATHNFFGGRVVAEYCSSTNDDYYMPYAQFKSVCPGGVEQVAGAGVADPAICAGFAAANSFDEQCDHGTHVAGIAAGNDGNNGTVNDGVARAANIIGIQAFTYIDCLGSNIYCFDVSDDGVTVYDTDIINGLNYVYSLRDTYQIASVNMSLGGGYYTSQSLCDSENAATKAVIDQLRSVKIATIIASGNDGYGTGIAAPACISTAVAVGSVSDVSELIGGQAGKISSFTNSSALLDLLAPGYNIYSSVTVPANIGFDWKSGTSMASPQVAGAWAVVREPLPNATVPQILQAFQATGTSVLDDERADGYICYRYPTPPYFLGPCSGLTFKMINVDAAINYLMPTIPNLVAPTATVMTSGKPTLSWTALRANQYKIFLDTVNPPLAELVTVNTPSYTLTTSLEPKVYYWRVQAFNSLGGVSGLSAVGSFSVDVPANRNYTTDTTPTLTWLGTSWATKYELQFANNSAFTGATLYTINAPGLSFTLPAQPPGTYYWRVRAYNGVTAQPYGPTESITIDP